MKLYKLTDSNNCTYNNTKWGENVTHTSSGSGELCGPGWLHAYTNPLLAVLLNPIHANYDSPNLWEAEGIIEKNDHGLKVGTTVLTTIKQIPIPEITTTQKVAFGILCVLEAYKDKRFTNWANNWLNNIDRTANTAANAADFDFVSVINKAMKIK